MDTEMSEMLVGVFLFPAIPTDMLRFLLGTHCLFANALCNSPYGLKQTQNMSGSVLLTTEASQLSVGIAEVAYYIENSKITSKKNYICGIIRDFRNVKQLGNTM